MNIDYCSYHGESAAIWYCRACDRHYGECCIPQVKQQLPRCVLCARDLESLGSANTITPFWNILHKFLAYPFKTNALILVLIFGLLANLMSMSVIGAIVGLFILVTSTRYAYEIIDQASQGKITPPSLMILLSVDSDRLFLKQIAVFFIAGAAVAAAGITGSTFLVFLVTAFITLALPASIIVLATERSLISAVNPLLLLQLMSRLGAGYFVLYAFINILGGGPVIVTEVLMTIIPDQFMVSVLTAATIYFWFATAYMMGYVLLQYQGQLGYRAVLEGGEQQSEEISSVEEIDRKVTVLIIEGRYEEANTMLKEALLRSPNEVVLQQRYNKLLAAMGRVDKLDDYSKGLINQLVEAGSIAVAIQVYVDAKKALPDFQIDSPEILHRFADLYRERQQYSSALALLSEITKNHSDYSNIGLVFLQVAKIYAENLNQPGKASPLVKYLLKAPNIDEAIKTEAQKLSNVVTSWQ